MVGCGLACPGGGGAGVSGCELGGWGGGGTVGARIRGLVSGGGGSWAIWGGGVATRNTGPYIYIYIYMQPPPPNPAREVRSF